MATNKKFAQEVVSKIENCLKDLKIKSETQSTTDEAIIYGKFSLEKEKYRVVVHLQKEDFIPVTKDCGEVKSVDNAEEDCAITPNLNFQSFNSNLRSYTQEEGLKIKKEFLEEAHKLIPKLNK